MQLYWTICNGTSPDTTGKSACYFYQGTFPSGIYRAGSSQNSSLNFGKKITKVNSFFGILFRIESSASSDSACGVKNKSTKSLIFIQSHIFLFFTLTVIEVVLQIQHQQQQHVKSINSIKLLNDFRFMVRLLKQLRKEFVKSALHPSSVTTSFFFFNGRQNLTFLAFTERQYKTPTCQFCATKVKNIKVKSQVTDNIF